MRVIFVIYWVHCKKKEGGGQYIWGKRGKNIVFATKNSMKHKNIRGAM